MANIGKLRFAILSNISKLRFTILANIGGFVQSVHRATSGEIIMLHNQIYSQTKCETAPIKSLIYGRV